MPTRSFDCPASRVLKRKGKPYAAAALFAFTVLAVALWGAISPLAVSLLAVALAVTARHRPHWVLSAGVMTKFTGGTESSISTLGSWLIIIALVVAVHHHLSTKHPRPVPFGIVPWLLLWLTLRPLAENNPALASTFALALTAVVTALLTAASKLSLAQPMAYASAAFIVYSALFGVMDPTGLRFAGISGNPNRMVAGVLLSLPFLVAVAIRSRSRIASLLLVGAGMEGCHLVLRSGSSQGYVALLVLTLGVTWFACRKWPAARWVLSYFVISGAMLGGLYVAMGGIALDDDTATLSGRVPLYEAAWGHIQQNWLLGTGASHFDAIYDPDRATHSMFLSLALIGGIATGIAWLVALAVRFRQMTSPGLPDSYSELAVVVFGTLSITQNLEAYPLAWIILTNTSVAYSLRTRTENKHEVATTSITRGLPVE